MYIFQSGILRQQLLRKQGIECDDMETGAEISGIQPVPTAGSKVQSGFKKALTIASQMEFIEEENEEDSEDDPDQSKKSGKSNLNGASPKTKRKRKTYKCRRCEKVCNSKNALHYHFLSHTGERPHQCEVCGKGFFAGSALKVFCFPSLNSNSFFFF